MGHDIDVTCVECGAPFTWHAYEQRFYLMRALSSPKRCKACRLARRARWADGSSHSHYATTRWLPGRNDDE